MKPKTLIAAAITASAMALSACDIDKTEEGRQPDIDVSVKSGQLPKYDVDVRKTREGRMPDVDVDADAGKLPKYDIDGPDIDVGTKEKTVEVPDVDVDMEERTITVPDVDIDLPDDNDKH